MVVEVNPRQGRPDFVIDVAKGGQRSLLPCPPVEDWKPYEDRESALVLFLSNPQGEVLLEPIRFWDEPRMLEHVEKCRLIFEPQAATPPQASEELIKTSDGPG